MFMKRSSKYLFPSSYVLNYLFRQIHCSLFRSFNKSHILSYMLSLNISNTAKELNRFIVVNGN